MVLKGYACESAGFDGMSASPSYAVLLRALARSGEILPRRRVVIVVSVLPGSSLAFPAVLFL